MRRVFSILTALACCALLCVHAFAAEQQKKVLIQLDKKITPAQVRALQQNYAIKPAAVYDKLGVQIWQLQELEDKPMVQSVRGFFNIWGADGRRHDCA